VPKKRLQRAAVPHAHRVFVQHSANAMDLRCAKWCWLAVASNQGVSAEVNRLQVGVSTRFATMPRSARPPSNTNHVRFQRSVFPEGY
jgi:hypothetical protein